MFEIIRALIIRGTENCIYKGNDFSALIRIANRLNELAVKIHTATAYRVRAVDQRLTINCIVRIVGTRRLKETPGYVGNVGVLVSLDARNQDGDFYGVVFADRPDREIYFWQDELEVIVPSGVSVQLCKSLDAGAA